MCGLIGHPPTDLYRRNNYCFIVILVVYLVELQTSPTAEKFTKAVVRWSEVLKNLQQATESRETISTSVDVTARKMGIELTQQMLQESQKAHDKAIAKMY